MTLTPEEIERIDREFLRDQERDRMSERTQQIWPIFLSLSTVFGFIGLQNNEGAYLVGLFPVLVSCLAQHVHDSEGTLKKSRRYLYQQEQDAGCPSGAEHFFQEWTVASSGGNKKALRKAFVTTSGLSTYLFITHLQQDHTPPLFVLVAACIEVVVTCQSFYWLTYWKGLLEWIRSRSVTRGRRSHEPP